MSFNYFKLSFRSLNKNRLFTTINILGPAFGLTCSILISLWVWDETQFDRFYENGESIYKILGQLKSDGGENIVQYAPSALVQPILENFPEVKKISRVFSSEVVIENNEVKFSENGVYADPSFLDIFSFSFKEGSNHKLFHNENTIVISEQVANKLFPNQSALSKEIVITQQGGDKANYIVAGVLEKIPDHSSLQFDFILNYESFEKRYRPWWQSSTNKWALSNFNVEVFVELNNNANVNHFNDRLSQFLFDYSDHASDDALFAYPFTEWYLYSDFSASQEPTGRIRYVRLFSLIAIIILVVASINFMNLSTAIAGKRAKEVGLRKSFGASRFKLIIHFTFESILIAGISMLLALTIADLALPFFNQITRKSIQIPFHSVEFMMIIAGLSIASGVLAGCYPAVYLSAFSPISSLRNYSTNKGGLSSVRKGLVIIQFVVSIVFITASIIIFNQISYLQNKDLGLRKNNIIHHFLHGVSENKDSYKNRLLQIPGVQSVSFTEHSPVNTSNGNRHVTWEGKNEDDIVYFNVMQVDGDFLRTFEIDLIDGKDFPGNQSNLPHFIINQSAAKAMMFDNPVGREITVWGKTAAILGVAEDFHHQELTNSIEPLIMLYNPNEIFRAFISFDTKDKSDLIQQIGELYSEYEQDYSFDYSFVEDQYDQSFSNITSIGNLSGVFSIVAIVVSCMGLFGLSAFMAEQKTKETGIRKIMGASQWRLLKWFTFDYIRLTCVAFLISFPITYFSINMWLSGFAYHTDLNAWPFIAGGAIALLIALSTVLYNTLRIVRVNAVDSLRYE